MGQAAGFRRGQERLMAVYLTDAFMGHKVEPQKTVVGIDEKQNFSVNMCFLSNCCKL